MRVATANIQHGHPATTTGRHAAAGLAAAIVPLEADVVALQEVDVRQARSGRIDEAAVAAGALGTPWWRLAAAYAGSVRG